MKKQKIKIILVLTTLLFPRTVSASPFDTVLGVTCTTYECWIQALWGWAMILMIPLSVLILSAAGVIYMISEGDSTRIGFAKKLIIGVFSGVGLLILARLLMTVVGIEGFYNV